ncbi:Synembryn [Oopsacas minuta]|uniref:Synembryn n=1 Tax=Oopsacas minuta TaxID=111878 RepID=A0AAV7K7X2_9METZ|nr:Synembryn [Oopsacas minuta]
MDLSSLKKALETDTTQNTENIINKLKKFNKDNAEIRKFDNTIKKPITTQLLKQIRDSIQNIYFTEDTSTDNLQLLLASTNCLRILTRDGTPELLLEIENIHSIASTGGLYYQDVPYCLAMKKGYLPASHIQTDAWIEGTKTLINIIFVNHNSGLISDIIDNMKNICLVESLLNRLKGYVGPVSIHLPLDLIVYDLKLLFLITACSPSERNRVLEDTDGFSIVCSLVHQWVHFSYRPDPPSLARKYLVSELSKQIDTALLEENIPLTSEMMFDVICVTSLPEIKVVGMIVDSLKILFSLTANWTTEFYDSPGNKDCLRRLYNDLRLLVVSFSGWCNADIVYKTLFNDCVNLLMNIPYSLIPVLIPKLGNVIFSKECLEITPPPCTLLEGACKVVAQNTRLLVQYEARNLSIIKLLVDRLDEELLCNEDKCDQMTLTKITLLPTLRTLSRGNSVIRHYVRKRVLPPLKKVTSRPEDGKDMKGRIVKLMIHSDYSLAYSTADFLFVLCKENVDRMVKYTGFGNAAGLLMQRGLMGGGSHEGEASYSSDSQDSDTEEFLQCQSNLDPITAAPKSKEPSEIDSMTEEEKEKEAVKLMDAIDKLNKSGFIKMVDTSGKEVDKENLPQ